MPRPQAMGEFHTLLPGLSLYVIPTQTAPAVGRIFPRAPQYTTSLLQELLPALNSLTGLASVQAHALSKEQPVPTTGPRFLSHLTGCLPLQGLIN